MVEVRYSSFAMPPLDIKLDKTYLFGHDSKGYFYVDKNENIYLELEEIKAIFTPIGKKWEEVLAIKRTRENE